MQEFHHPNENVFVVGDQFQNNITYNQDIGNSNGSGTGAASLEFGQNQ